MSSVRTLEDFPLGPRESWVLFAFEPDTPPLAHPLSEEVGVLPWLCSSPQAENTFWRLRADLLHSAFCERSQWELGPPPCARIYALAKQIRAAPQPTHLGITRFPAAAGALVLNLFI